MLRRSAVQLALGRQATSCHDSFSIPRKQAVLVVLGELSQIDAFKSGKEPISSQRQLLY